MDARSELDQIRQRAENATDGPWQSSDRGGGTYEVHREPQWHDDDGWIAWTGRAGHDREDAEFIAAARSDVPRLVAFALAVLDLADMADERCDYGTITGDGIDYGGPIILTNELRALAEQHLTNGDDR